MDGSTSDGPRADCPLRLKHLRNLGPRSEQLLIAAGIGTPEALDRVGAVVAFLAELHDGE
jgi:hypothetical protein